MDQHISALGAGGHAFGGEQAPGGKVRRLDDDEDAASKTQLVGPAQAIAVTYLIPVFAIGWGLLFLGEQLTLTMLVGGAIVLLGTALATGFIGGPKRR